MILLIDMHIRDQRVRNYIKSRVKRSGGECQITMSELARHFKCHPNTISSIIRRLSYAEDGICVDRSAKKGGYTYREPIERTNRA